MAFKKICDYDECGKTLGSQGSFLQLHGSVSEQLEEDGNVEYRYLTPHPNSKLAYCNTTCLVGWIEQEKARSSFTRRAPRDYEGY